MEYGYKNTIAEEDLCDIRRLDRSEENGARLARAWADEEVRAHASFWRALAKAYWRQYVIAGLNELSAATLNLMQPAILQQLIKWVVSQSTSSPQPYSRAFAFSFLLFAASCLQSLFIQHYFQLVFETGAHIRAATQVTMYRKSLRLSSQARGAKSIGDIVNLMSVDAQKFYILARAGHALWSGPLQLVIAMSLLYRLVGWSMLAGVAIMVAIAPMNTIVAHFLGKYGVAQMEARDERMGITSEIIENMKCMLSRIHTFTLEAS